MHISPEAATDLAGIWEYVAQDSPEQAGNLIQAILDTADRLVVTPEMGRRRDELRKGWRSIGEGEYLIFYEVVHRDVRVLRVVHGARHLAKVLKKKK